MIDHPQRRLVRRATTSAVAFAMLAGSVAGCGLSNLQFRQDRRLTFVSPENLSTVPLPVTVSWRFADTGDLPAGAEFAVFVDRYPMAPGKDLRSIVDADPACRGSDQCLAPDYLTNGYGIYLTDKDSVVVNSLPTSSTASADDSHYVTVVLLDHGGNRIGESVWFVSFRVSA